MMMLALTQVIFSLATVVSGMARPQTLWTETIQEKLSLRRVFLLSWFCMRYSKLWILSWEHLFFCCAKQALIATTPWLPWGTRLASQGAFICQISATAVSDVLTLKRRTPDHAVQSDIVPCNWTIYLSGDQTCEHGKSPNRRWYVLPSGNQTWQQVHPL